MRAPGKIHLEWAIAHVIDHHHYEEPILSDFPLALANRPRLREYFEGQIESVLADPEAVAAAFLAPEEHPVAKACYHILAPPKKLKRPSQDLARALFAAIGGNRSIAGGNFVVLTYSGESYPGVAFLALLKIDLTEVLIQEIETDSKGRRSVTYSVHENALPTLGRKLQKAAVIRLAGNPVRDFEVLLLDKQVAKAAADFFTKRFLNVEPIYNTQQRTEQLFTALTQAHRKLIRPAREGVEPILEPAAGNEALDQIRNVLQRQTVDSTAFVNSLDVPDAAKAVFKEEIRKRLTEEQFDIDPAYARSRLIPKRRFVGGFGIDVQFDAEFEEAVIRSLDTEEMDDGSTVTVVCLEVPDFKWIK